MCRSFETNDTTAPDGIRDGARVDGSLADETIRPIRGWRGSLRIRSSDNERLVVVCFISNGMRRRQFRRTAVCRTAEWDIGGSEGTAVITVETTAITKFPIVVSFLHLEKMSKCTHQKVVSHASVCGAPYPSIYPDDLECNSTINHGKNQVT